MAKTNTKAKTKRKTKNQARGSAKAKATAKDSKFSPRILAFCCNWCSYAGADLAGVSRIQYSPNIRIIRVMCSGRVEPAHIFAAFEAGADGVIVSGCHIGDCHYISGNLFAEAQIERLKKLFNIIGFDERRLRLQWVSASEGRLFAEYIEDFVELIETLGPNPLVIEPRTSQSGQDSLAAKTENNRAKRSRKAVVPA
jgi:F420-non-reducing hydrogenase iron-sulfur subunit